jgi:PqqD family protein of HPr-rel-A system
MTKASAARPVEGRHGQDLGDEYLLYDRQSDQVHVLNGTARVVFLLCDGTRSDAEVAGELATRYDVDPETATADAVRTVEELIRLGFLTRG